MKKLNLPITWLYIVLTFITTTIILVPLLFWTYSDLKEETEKNINKFFYQSKGIIEVVLEDKVNSIDNVLNTLSLDLENIEKNIDNFENLNIDILFYQSKDEDIKDLSTGFMYDTKSIIEGILKDGIKEQKYLLNIKLKDKIISIVYSFKKIIQKDTGRVLGIICAGEILNDNLSILSEMIEKTSLKSVSFGYKDKIIASTINMNSIEYKNLTKEFNTKNLLLETTNSIYYKNILSCKNVVCPDNTVILSTDNLSLEALQKEFIKKASVLIAFFLVLTIIGYLLTKRFLLRPLSNLTDFTKKGDVRKKFTIVKEINFIVENLYKTLRFLDEYKKVVDEASIVSKGDLSGNITYVNENFCKTTGYTEDELLGRPHNILRDPAVEKAIFKHMWETIRENKKTWVGYLSNKKKNGEIFYIKLVVTPILNMRGEIVEYIALRENITELVESKQELQKIYTTDKLTKLYTRYQLTLDLKVETKIILVLINIDSFSEINDFYGNVIGDNILIEFSNLLEKHFKDSAYKIYRVYGDEFAVAIKSTNTDEVYADTKKFLSLLDNTDFELEGLKINLRATAGISLSKGDKFTSADLALKSAKKDNKDCEIYHEDNQISKDHHNNIFWTRKVKDALSEDRIVPYYQAIRNNITGKIEKYEVLVRLIRSNGDVVSPFFFLDIAKKSKLYDQLTRRVVEKSFEYFSDKEYEFSINLTVDDVLNEETVKFIEEALQRYNVAQKVVLEIVESEQIENFELITKFINTFKSYGCKIAIDDFGTGYSNFEYLIKLSADYIKIDGSLTKNMIDDKNIYSVVETIVNFAKKSDLKVIAEFVSSPELQEKVEELGIEYSQGYYFGQPQKEI